MNISIEWLEQYGWTMKNSLMNWTGFGMDLNDDWKHFSEFHYCSNCIIFEWMETKYIMKRNTNQLLLNFSENEGNFWVDYMVKLTKLRSFWFGIFIEVNWSDKFLLSCRINEILTTNWTGERQVWFHISRKQNPTWHQKGLNKNRHQRNRHQSKRQKISARELHLTDLDDHSCLERILDDLDIGDLLKVAVMSKQMRVAAQVAIGRKYTWQFLITGNFQITSNRYQYELTNDDRIQSSSARVLLRFLRCFGQYVSHLIIIIYSKRHHKLFQFIFEAICMLFERFVEGTDNYHRCKHRTKFGFRETAVHACRRDVVLRVQYIERAFQMAVPKCAEDICFVDIGIEQSRTAFSGIKKSLQ